MNKTIRRILGITHNHPVGRLVVVVTLVWNAFALGWGNVRQVSASSDSAARQNNDPALTTKIYDDSDIAWTYSGDWSEAAARRAYTGKLHISSTVGDSAEISVTGSRFTLVFSKAQDYGKLDAYVDGARIGTINQQRTKTGYQVDWISPQFELGPHLIKFVHASGKHVSLDAIKVRVPDTSLPGAPTATPTTEMAATLAPTIGPSATELPASAVSATSTPILPTDTAVPTLTPESTLSAATVAPATNTATQAPTATSTFTQTPSPTSTLMPTATNTLIPAFTPTATSDLPLTVLSTTATPTPTSGTTTGKVYYVSLSGSDTNAGTLSQPWKTLNYAAGKLVAGDTLYVRGGTYAQQSLRIATSGTASAPITIAGYPNEKVVLDGQGVFPSSSGSYMITIKANWIVVKDLEIANSGQSGVFSSGTHVTVQNLQIHHAQGAAITLTGDYDLAVNNRAWSDGLMNENFKSGTTGGWPAIVTCARYPQHCTLRGNTVSNSWGEGISTFEATYTTIEDNVSYNNQQNFYISDTKYSVMQRNLSYCTAGNAIDPYVTQNGILVGDEKGVLINGVRYPSSDNQIVNNLVMGCDRNLAAGTKVSTNNLYAYNTFVNSGGNANEKANVLIYASGSCTNCRFTDNVILQENSNPITLGGGLSTGWTFANNLWSRLPGSNFKGTGDIIANPLLAKAGLTGPGQLTADYFKLTAGSPAVNKAAALTKVNADYFKKLRGTYPDIGAHEYMQ